MEGSAKMTKRIVVLAIVVVVLAGAWKQLGPGGYRPDANLYQVVLLANDQVFYGKLHKADTAYPYLTDVYYLNPQRADFDKYGQQIGGNKFTVVKRGYDELHQPTDGLYLESKNVLYWENVGADSLVAKGIKADKEYRAKQAGAMAAAKEKAPAAVPAK